MGHTCFWTLCHEISHAVDFHMYFISIFGKQVIYLQYSDKLPIPLLPTQYFMYLRSLLTDVCVRSRTGWQMTVML